MKNPTGDPQLDIVAQRWPNIERAEAEGVLAALAEPRHALAIVAYSGRPTSAGSMVRTDRGDVFIKRYSRLVREASCVRAYHRFAVHLAAKGIDTPPFLRFAHRDGTFRSASCGSQPGRVESAVVDDTVLVTDHAIYEVSQRAHGDDRYHDALSWDPPRSIREAEALGTYMARMAQASQDFVAPEPGSTDPFQNHFGLFTETDVDAALGDWLSKRPGVAAYLRSSGRDLDRDLAAHRAYGRHIAQPYRKLPARWTHGDPHISNFMWEGSAPVSVIDFGLADRNTALFDLVETLERNTIQFVDIMNGHDECCRADLAVAILRGYHRVRPLGSADLDLIAGMLPISQSEAALNWIAYYMTGTPRPEDAAWCYDISLMGHTAWFARAAERRYLDAVRDCADQLTQ